MHIYCRYLIAQLLVVASLTLTPFALVSAIFGTTLLFDDLIAFFVLGKRFNAAEIIGLLVIMGSLGVSAMFSPDCEYDLFPTPLQAPITNSTAHELAHMSGGPWALQTMLAHGPHNASKDLCKGLGNRTLPIVVVEESLATPAAAMVLGLLFVIIVGGWLAVRTFEKKYPGFPEDESVKVPAVVYRSMQIVYPAILV